jgi:sigma-E factor negative regulatory protein RseA
MDMNTVEELARQKISALADGGLNDKEIESALEMFRNDDRRDDWDVYHQIGDLLRSSDMDVKFSPGFSARMAARLEMEPTIVAPGAAAQVASVPAADTELQAATISSNLKKRHVKYWFASGLAAAGVAAALTGAPHLMTATGKLLTDRESMVVALSSDTRQATNSPGAALQEAAGTPGIVMRDTHIDDYLLAHQRFSPSLYGVTHYARTAAFATDSTK